MEFIGSEQGPKYPKLYNLQSNSLSNQVSMIPGSGWSKLVKRNIHYLSSQYVPDFPWGSDELRAYQAMDGVSMRYSTNASIKLWPPHWENFSITFWASISEIWAPSIRSWKFLMNFLTNKLDSIDSANLTLPSSSFLPQNSKKPFIRVQSGERTQVLD